VPSPDFDPLVKQLLDLGIAQKYALRLGRELEDHFADLEEEALRNKKSRASAAAEARLRLGDAASIEAAFREHGELKSWIYRSRLVWNCLYALSWLALLALTGLLAILRQRAVAGRLALACAAAVVLTSALLLALDVTVSLGKLGEPDARARSAGHVVAVAAPIRILTPPSALSAAIAQRTKPAKLTPPTGLPERTRITSSYAAEIEFAAEITPSGPRLAGTAFRVSEPFQVSDGDYLPIVKVAPVFPALAAARGMEGYVVIEYTVTTIGSVQDVVVVESSSNVFEASAVKAAYRFKYKPRVIDGRAVPVRGVRTRVSFKLRA